jgi:hypothetical protein
MVDTIPVDEYQRWYPPRAAIDRLRPTRTAVVIDALTACIRSGAVRAAAHQVFEVHQSGRSGQVAVYKLLEAGRWIEEAEERFWELGNITIKPEVRRASAVEALIVRQEGPDIELTGVRLDRTGVDNLAAQLGVAPRARSFNEVMADRNREDRIDVSSAQAVRSIVEASAIQASLDIKPNEDVAEDFIARTAPELTAPLINVDPGPNKGGRPRKDFWEPVLVAAGIAIYAGWQPGKIADAERWMADWLSARGHEASEVAIRERARALFNAYVAERDKN